MIDEPKIIKRDLNKLSFNENKNLFGSLINEIYELFFNTLPFLTSFFIFFTPTVFICYLNINTVPFWFLSQGSSPNFNVTINKESLYLWLH